MRYTVILRNHHTRRVIAKVERSSRAGAQRVFARMFDQRCRKAQDIEMRNTRGVLVAATGTGY